MGMEASRRFGRYKAESVKKVLKPSLVNDTTLKKLTDAWLSVGWIDHYLELIDENLSAILRHIKDIQYTAKDVEKFSIALAEFQGGRYFNERAGYFLSALINNGPESDYVVHTRQLSENIDLLGLKNTKNITLNGNAGQFVGMFMVSGKLIIKGSALWMTGSSLKGGEILIQGNGGFYLGNQMDDGKIIVEGSTEKDVGEHMKGGRIFVHGNGGISLGSYMAGGEIHVGGDIGWIGSIKHGKIFHKGKLIVDK
jgi:hypothetical protein